MGLTTFDDAFLMFLNDKSVYCAPDTIRFYKDCFSRFSGYIKSQNIIYITDIDISTLKLFVLYLRSGKIKNTSVNTYMRGVKAFIFWCFDNGLIPYFKYTIKLPRPDNKLVLPLSVDEVDKCISTLKNTRFGLRNVIIFRLMLDCGLRSQEVLHLCPDNIDNGHLIINNSKCNKSRIVPCPDPVYKLLDEYLHDQKISDPDQYLFSLSDNGKKQLFSKLKYKSGVLRVHPHLLRHTFATAYMLQRGNLEFLRMYLGHSSYDVTKHYIQSAFQCNLIDYPCYRIDDCFK